jgi:hypothetical protein
MISLFILLLDATFWLFIAVIPACHLSVQTTLNQSPELAHTVPHRRWLGPFVGINDLVGMM